MHGAARVSLELELQHSTDSSRHLLGDIFTFPLGLMKDWKFNLSEIQRTNFDFIPSLQELGPWHGWIVPLCSTSTRGEKARKRKAPGFFTKQSRKSFRAPAPTQDSRSTEASELFLQMSNTLPCDGISKRKMGIKFCAAKTGMQQCCE